jgi:hypothetical protein
MEVVAYASEHDEVKDLLEMKKSLKWGDEDEKFLERLELIQKKWLKKLKLAAAGKVKTEAKPPAAQPVGHMKWDDHKVVYTDKKSKEFDQVKKNLGKYREGKWGNPKGRTRGNGFWRHYVHTDAQGVESHIKVLKKEKGFEFVTGLVSGVLIPETDSEKEDNDAVSEAEEAASPAKSIAPAPDTDALPASGKRKRKASGQAEAPEAAPGKPKGKAAKKKRH